MADVKICDCCGKVIIDLHEARMKAFYFNEEPVGESKCFFKLRKETPPLTVDLCGECWDTIRGFAGGKKDGK